MIRIIKKSRLNELESTKTLLEEKVKQLQSVKDAGKKLSDIMIEIKTAKFDLAKIRSDHANIRSDHANIRSDHANAKSELAETLKALTRYEQSAEEYKQSAEKNEGLARDLREATVRHNQLLEEVEAANRGSREKRDASFLELDTYNAQLKELKGRCSDIIDHESLTKQLESLTKELESVRRERDKASDDLENHRQHLTESRGLRSAESAMAIFECDLSTGLVSDWAPELVAALLRYDSDRARQWLLEVLARKPEGFPISWDERYRGLIVDETPIEDLFVAYAEEGNGAEVPLDRIVSCWQKYVSASNA